jgi:NAD/NADP transhydrogenase alpha subunit
MPLHASMMYSRTVLTLVQLCIKDGALNLNLQDDLVAAMLVTLDGVIRHA